MKKLLFICAFLFIGMAQYFAQNPGNGVAQICFQSGECYEISRIFYDGEWHDACCWSVTTPQGGSCNDDCTGGTLPIAPPPPPFYNTPPDYVLSAGNEAWVLDDNELVQNTIEDGDPMAVFLNTIPNFDFVNQMQDILFFEIVYEEDITVMITNSSSASERRSFFKEMVDGLDNKIEEIKLYPNPFAGNGRLTIKSLVPLEYKKIELFQSNGNKVLVINQQDLSKVGENITEFTLNKSLENGVYSVRIQMTGGRVVSRSLIIK